MYIVNLLTSPNCIVLKLRAVFFFCHRLRFDSSYHVGLLEVETTREGTFFLSFFLCRNLKFAKCLLCLYGLFFIIIILSTSLSLTL